PPVYAGGFERAENRSLKPAMCYPCPRTCVSYVSGLYSEAKKSKSPPGDSRPAKPRKENTLSNK
ncbi:MAG: hypothetical protein ABIQ90_12645, partial [Polaromonas sp.]